MVETKTSMGPEESSSVKPPNLPGKKFSWSAFGSVLQLVLSVVAVIAALIWIVFNPTHQTEIETEVQDASKLVDLTDDGLIRVPLDTPLGRRLTRFKVLKTDTTDALIRSSGMVIASRRPGTNGQADFWQFSSEELLTNYSDWERARTDAEFNQSVAIQVKAIGEATEKGLNVAIDRMERLVKTGTETTRDLESLRTQLIQSQLQTQKDLYEAEAAVRTAKKSLDTLGLKLARFGLDPGWLQQATADLDVIAIEVPEGLLNRVMREQSAEAKFYGLPDVTFTGTVQTVSPVLSTEQRTLRVIVVLNDPDDRLRPGMYANIGLGTDQRQVIQIPATSLIHIGDEDFVLQIESSAENATSDATSDYLLLKPVAVQVRETNMLMVDVENALHEQSEIIGDHAILLKPLIVRALKHPSRAAIGDQTEHKESQGAN